MAIKTRKWVIAKGDLYANVDRKFGGKPRVYGTLREAQYDITHHAALRAGVVKPYTGTEVAKTPGFATTDQTKVAAPAAKPRRAADGLPHPTITTKARGVMPAPPAHPGRAVGAAAAEALAAAKTVGTVVPKRGAPRS